jgi:hypothetical protein
MSKANSPAHVRSINAFSAFGLGLLVGAAALAQSPPAIAQTQERIKAGLEIWKSSGCADCHGPFADGNPEDGDYPIGANLRTTRLDTASLKATISCGRPGTGMPSFDEGAYKVRACDGRPLGPAPGNLQPTPRTLSLEEIDTLIAYLQARIIGRGKITQEECLSYFENAFSSSCDDLK